MNRREFLTAVSAGIVGIVGCLSPSEGNVRRESTLIIENQRDSEQEVVIRFEDGDIVLFEETFGLAAGDQQQVEDDLSRGTTQVDIFIDPRSSREGIYEDTAPGGVSEYRVTLRSDGIDIEWSED